ncbi:hypothetical protein K461DRAFT_291026 [Myriangium duriaei CBS 260.36]|uniref:DNA-directed RNA polymerase I, II, and III subunit RPABC4 n=1 Tax=Myriangium duriaei CBS 260.36 TaxID=1168546 RepID=A0A9P4MK82_9PEZI|nr:hypothetical protein K461DRAFT_291026 [Myriangium duriaei CBS 260.36]
MRNSASGPDVAARANLSPPSKAGLLDARAPLQSLSLRTTINNKAARTLSPLTTSVIIAKMSREAFQAPSLPTSSQNQGNSTAFSAPTAGFEDTSRPVGYLCGDCDAKVFLKRGDPIRCKECGYRVLYKERTNRMIQFEAR